MKNLIKSILSQEFINNFYHLPKAVLANIVYGFPARGLKIVGITGTDGKTTTTNMVYQILKAAGKKTAMISTVSAAAGNNKYDTGFHVTSPDPFMVQRLAKAAKESGDEYLVLEVTSHALDQYRFWGVRFDVGIITNITHEHLDYHKSFQNYARTKFKLLQGVKTAVINQSVRGFRELRDFEGDGADIITFGLSQGDFNQKELKLRLKVLGDYNIENALAALGAAFALGIDRRIAQKALEDFTGITGRMEEIENNRGIKIIVDFAHTPNALEQALQALRSDTKGNLIAVFGAAGKRDVGKRFLMGTVTAKLASFVIITAEDPRGELQIINQQILGGAIKAGKKAGKDLFIIEDRAEAINFAINKLAEKGDTVGIFGKGHEGSMNLDGKKEIPWSDKKAAMDVLKQRHGF